MSLRDCDIRAMLGLVGEVGELPRDRNIRTRHLLKRTAELIGARVSSVASGEFDQDWNIACISETSLGWQNDQEYQVHQHYMGECLGKELTYPVIREELKRNWGKQTVVTSWRRIVPVEEWYRSAFVNEVFRPSGIDESLYVMYMLPHKRTAVGLTLSRDWGSRSPFTKRDGLMLNYIYGAFANFIEAPLQCPVLLGPRAEQVQACLLRGMAAKHIAAELKIGIHTVNDHIRTIYRRHDVESHPELMAKLLRN